MARLTVTVDLPDAALARRHADDPGLAPRGPRTPGSARHRRARARVPCRGRGPGRLGRAPGSVPAPPCQPQPMAQPGPLLVGHDDELEIDLLHAGDASAAACGCARPARRRPARRPPGRATTTSTRRRRVPHRARPGRASPSVRPELGILDGAPVRTPSCVWSGAMALPRLGWVSGLTGAPSSARRRIRPASPQLEGLDPSVDYRP